MERSPGRATAGDSAAVGHPLDPLTADEIRKTTAILRRDRGMDRRWRFASIELKEPSKDAVASFLAGRSDPARGAGGLLEPRGRRPDAAGSAQDVVR